MQPPFFNPEADDAVNFGAMGAIVGHEMTHGFDDQGCKYNSDGNMIGDLNADFRPRTRSFGSGRDLSVGRQTGGRPRTRLSTRRGWR